MRTASGVIIAPTPAITSSKTKHVKSRFATRFGLGALQAIQYVKRQSECDPRISYALQVKDGSPLASERGFIYEKRAV